MSMVYLCIFWFYDSCICKDIKYLSSFFLVRLKWIRHGQIDAEEGHTYCLLLFVCSLNFQKYWNLHISVIGRSDECIEGQIYFVLWSPEWKTLHEKLYLEYIPEMHDCVIFKKVLNTGCNKARKIGRAEPGIKQLFSELKRKITCTCKSTEFQVITV